MSSKNFGFYQIARAAIPKAKSFEEYKSVIFDLLNMKHISHDQYTGLVREWRAFNWVKARYSTYKVRLSTADEDTKGIDIVADRKDIKWKFAVSGPADKELHLVCDFKLIVTSNKIYAQRTI